jgi:predicted transcriptional regulator
MKYRDRNELIAQILECCNGNRVTRTKIMFYTYLSFNLTKEYLLLLIITINCKSAMNASLEEVT